jgi:hypothetical protein
MKRKVVCGLIAKAMNSIEITNQVGCRTAAGDQHGALDTPDWEMNLDEVREPNWKFGPIE